MFAFVPLVSFNRLCDTNLKTRAYSNSHVVRLYLRELHCLQGGASTALMIAAQEGNCEIVKLLLEHGADVKAVNKVIIWSNAVML